MPQPNVLLPPSVLLLSITVLFKPERSYGGSVLVLLREVSTSVELVGTVSFELVAGNKSGELSSSGIEISGSDCTVVFIGDSTEVVFVGALAGTSIST